MPLSFGDDFIGNGHFSLEGRNEVFDITTEQ